MEVHLCIYCDAINVLSGLLMLVTFCARLRQTLKGWEEDEFLKVLKALIKYADQYTASPGGMLLPSSHPLRKALQVLTKVDSKHFKQTAQKAWAIILHTQDEVLGQSFGHSGILEARIDLAHFNTCATEVEHPGGMHTFVNGLLQSLEAKRGKSHPTCVELRRRKVAFFVEREGPPSQSESHIAIMTGIIRSNEKYKRMSNAYRLEAEHHRARGDETAALISLRASLDCLVAVYGHVDIAMTGFTSEIRQWALERNNQEEAVKIGLWLKEIQMLGYKLR